MSSNVISTENEEEAFLNSDKVVLVVNLLTKLKVKLWEMDDFEASQSKENEDLLMKISDESGLMEIEVKEILTKLQKHSKDKFQKNSKFKAEGLANLKLKIVGNHNQKSPKSFTQNIEISINTLGSGLKSFIKKELDLDCSDMKLICNGKVIRDDVFLSSQNIKNFSTIFVMCIYDHVLNDVAKNSADQKLINDIKDAVAFLNEEKFKLSETSSKAEFKVKNQNGIELKISESDRNSLTIAMILHEKGKTFINTKDYVKALLLLAEADGEFKNCRDTSLLESVDNYALLNLDIIWCYLNLENLSELKNVEERLTTCETCLTRCYGVDMHRLTMLKNESAIKHIPIFVRLNLLKAILNYHKGKKVEAKQYLGIASDKLNQVKIDEDKLVQVMSLGFTHVEAKLALRAAFNDIDLAVEQILKKRQREKQAKDVELARHLEEKFGFTETQKKPINIESMKNLKELGYTQSQAAKVLIKTDNDFDLSLAILNSNPNFENDYNLEKLMTMGFSQELSELCLKVYGGNLLKALDFLTSNKHEWADPRVMLEDKLKSMAQDSENSGSDAEEATTSKSSSKHKNAIKVYEDLAGEMAKDDEAYLDFNLTEDEFYINKYYSLLK